MPKISTWQERLKACFSLQHRAAQVFGIPAAVGALSSIAGAQALNPDAGLALGGLVAGVGTLLYGYFIVAGFDRKLEEQLHGEESAQNEEKRRAELEAAFDEAPQEIQDKVRRIFKHAKAIEAEFEDGIDDQVENVLQNSLEDIHALHERAQMMMQLYNKLQKVVANSSGQRLQGEVDRLETDLKGASQDVQSSLEAALDSAKRTLNQFHAANAKLKQVKSVLTVIESSLHEFKLQMELRKADAAISSGDQAVDVSELQERLIATGAACDELVGRKPAGRRRRARG